jgi:phosphoribosylanthranilate isomerase
VRRLAPPGEWVRFKICCIRDEDELATAVMVGASAVGLVSAMPSGPGPIDDDTIARLLRRVPPGVSSFLLTCETEADALVEQWRRLPADCLQLVDRVGPETYGRLREAIPGVRLVQVIHVEGEEAVEEARAAVDGPDGHGADAILLDSGRPGAEVPELGGTGRVHDWAVSRAVVEAVDVPVFLAGGMNGDNVAGAVAAVQPYAVDVCSGVRTHGRLDPVKLEAFVRGATNR